MFLDRKNRFQHIICTVVKDKVTGKYQSFSRGEAIAVFTNCTDYWNGKDVVPITQKVRSNIKEIIKQWETVDFDQIGFSYKPVTPDFLVELEKKDKNYDKQKSKEFLSK